VKRAQALLTLDHLGQDGAGSLIQPLVFRGGGRLFLFECARSGFNRAA
jgi:hypothetical protein